MPSHDGNSRFKFGFGLGIVIFVLANIVSAITTANAFAEREIKFAHDGYSWGFPLRMYRSFLGYPSNDIGFEIVPTAINIVIASAFAGVLGIVLQMAGDRFWKD